MSDRLFISGLCILLVVSIAGLIASTMAEAEACTKLGGHILSRSSPAFGLSSGGQMVTTFNTVSFCVSDDGRILQ